MPQPPETPPPGTPSQGAAWPLAAALVVALIWSATPAMTLVAARGIPAVEIGLFRTLFAAAAILPVALALRWPLPRDRAGWLDLGLSAGLGFATYPLLTSIGVANTSTAHAAVIFALPPVITGLIGFLVSRAWPRWLWWLGALIAMGGQSLLMLGREPAPGAVNPATLTGDLTVLAAAIVVSGAYVAGGRLAGRVGTWAGTAWSIVLAGVVMLPWSVPALLARDWAAVTPESLGALAFLVVLTVLVGYALWYWALAVGGTARMAPVQFLITPFTLVLAVALFGESIGWPVLAASAAVIAGVAVCRRA